MFKILKSNRKCANVLLQSNLELRCYVEITKKMRSIHLKVTMVWFMVFNATFNNISVIYIMVVSFIDGGNRSTQRTSPTCRKSLTNLSHNVVSSRPRLGGVRTHNISGDRQ